MRVEWSADCARLHAAAFAHPWSTEDIAALLVAPSTLSAAALDPAGGQLRGFVIARLAADEAEILSLAVEAHARGKGVGKALLGESLRQAANAGARKMFLEVGADNPSAIALYSGAGFVKIGERAGYYRRAGAPATAILMRRDLA